MFFFGHFFFSFFVSSQFLRRFSRLKIVHHVSRVRRVRAAVPHRQGTYSSRFPKTTTTTTTIVKVVFAPFFLSSSPSFFFQRQSALKVVSLSIAKQKRTLWTCRSSLSLSLSLSLHIRNKAPSRDFEASRRKRQTSPPRRAWRER